MEEDSTSSEVGFDDLSDGDTYDKVVAGESDRAFDPKKYWRSLEFDVNVIALRGIKAAEEARSKEERERANVKEGGRKAKVKHEREEVKTPPRKKVKRESTTTPQSTKANQESAKKQWSTIFSPKLRKDATTMDLDPPPPTPTPTPEASPAKSTELFNPYEGDETAKQLSEPLSTFFSRLPPSATTTASGPWIWIANPHSPRRLTHSDIAGFKDEGTDLLTTYITRKRTIEKQNSTKPPAAITRLLKPDRDRLEASITHLAVKRSVTGGKWMLFPHHKHVDQVWKTVATATWAGQLGCSAKVATDAGEKKDERLICIYTTDFTDRDDVTRVLREMAALGLVKREDEARGVYYKSDAYTYLDIMSGNEYKLKASLYGSREMFREMDGEK